MIVERVAYEAAVGRFFREMPLSCDRGASCENFEKFQVFDVEADVDEDF